MEKTYVNTIEYHWIPVFCLAADFFGANCTASSTERHSCLLVLCPWCWWVLRRSSENKYICSTTQPQSAWYCPTPLLVSCKPLMTLIFSPTLSQRLHIAQRKTSALLCWATPLEAQHLFVARTKLSSDKNHHWRPRLQWLQWLRLSWEQWLLSSQSLLNEVLHCS